MKSRISAARKAMGAATLAFALLLMLLIFGVVLFANRNILFESRTSNNQYRAAQAKEAAEAGLERGVAWLSARVTATASTSCGTGAAPVQWEKAAISACPAGLPVTPRCDGTQPCACLTVNDACNNGLNALQGFVFPAAANTGQDQFNVTTHFRVRATGSQINDVEVIASAGTALVPGATAADPYASRAVLIERIRLTPFTATPGPGNPQAPILIHGSLTDSGNPDVCPSNVAAGDEGLKGGGHYPPCAVGPGVGAGPSIVTFQPNASVLDTSKFNLHGSTPTALNAPGSTVHSVLFPNLTADQIRAMSEFQRVNLPAEQRTVFYYGAGSGDSMPSNFSVSDFGSSADKPVIIYVDRSSFSSPNACPGLGPGEYFGVMYIGGDCNASGFGNVNFHGTLAFAGSVTRFNANAVIRYWDTSGLLGGGPVLTPGSFIRLPGSWQDLSR